MKLKAPKKSQPTVADFFSRLLNSVTQAHIFHLQVSGTGSFAAHKALEDYYTGAGDLADSLIESYQADGSIVKGYMSEDYQDVSPGACAKYFGDLLKYVEENKKLFSDSSLLNQIDEIKTLIRSTLYKLEHLS